MGLEHEGMGGKNVGKKMKTKINFVVVSIFSAVVLVGYIANHILLDLLLSQIVIRNLVVMSLSYISFFGFMKLWIFSISKDSAYLKNASEVAIRLKQMKEETSGQKPDDKKKISIGADVGLNFLDAIFSGLGEAFPVVIVIFLGCFAVILAIWLVDVATSMIFFESILDVTLASGLISVTKYVRQGDWHINVFNKTIWIFLAILFLSSVWLFTIDHQCPGHARISEIANACWTKKAAP